MARSNKLKEIPDRYLGMIIHFFMNLHNDTSEFRQPHLRKSFENSYMFFVVVYGALMLAGFIANIYLLRELFLQRQQKLRCHRFLACNAINDLLKCIIVLPVALSTTLFQNWIYGSFLCNFFPMMQDIPFNATMLTFLLITFDRYRQILYPIKPHFPSFFCMLSVWIASVFAVLPYAIYTRYLDLEPYLGEQFKDAGICVVNIEDNIEEYIRGLFILMYVLPLGLIAFMHVKTSEEIKTRQSAYSVVYHETSKSNRRETDPLTATVSLPSGSDSSRKGSSMTLTVPATTLGPPRPSRDEQVSQETSVRVSRASSCDDDCDWAREKRIQDYIVTVISVYAACLLPLNIVRLLKHVVSETTENSFHFDITFITVVWIAFIPTVATPILFKTSQMSGNRLIDISRYLRLGRASDVSFANYDATKRCSTTSRNPSYVENVQPKSL